MSATPTQRNATQRNAKSSGPGEANKWPLQPEEARSDIQNAIGPVVLLRTHDRENFVNFPEPTAD